MRQVVAKEGRGVSPHKAALMQSAAAAYRRMEQDP